MLTMPQTIDLLNVAFENPRKTANASQNVNGASTDYLTPDRQTGLQTLQELRRLRPEREWNFVQVNVPYAEFLEHRAHIVELMWPNDTAMDLVSALNSRRHQLTTATEHRTSTVLCSTRCRLTGGLRAALHIVSTRPAERTRRRRVTRRLLEA